MFIGLAIIFIGLITIIWSTAYALTTLICTIAENKERKRIEAREALDRRAREARRKEWDEIFAQMTEEEFEDFMNCPFT